MKLYFKFPFPIVCCNWCLHINHVSCAFANTPVIFSSWFLGYFGISYVKICVTCIMVMFFFLAFPLLECLGSPTPYLIKWEGGPPLTFPDVREKAFSFLPPSMMLAKSFFIDNFYQIKENPIYYSVLRILMWLGF